MFPGGNLSEDQDGSVPSPSSPLRHVDSEVYRRAAIRECFEESGILLAKSRQENSATGENEAPQMLSISSTEKERARKGVHANTLNFTEWVEKQGGELDSGECSRDWCLSFRFYTLIRALTFDISWPDTIYPVDHSPKYSKAVHDPNVSLLPASTFGQP